jgi:uncharacterized protein YmfQ (DUF2313 family)
VLSDILAELPDGAASTDSADDFLGARYRPLANEISLLEASGVEMLAEIDPRSAPHLLPEWESVVDSAEILGDPANYDAGTRGQIAYALLTNAGTICAGYFERLALLIGETITITEFPGSVCGVSVCGDTALNPPPNHCAFQVSLPAKDVVTAICGVTQCGESLGSFVPSVMEGFIRAGAPLFATPYFKFE